MSEHLIQAPLDQLVRSPACHVGGQGFKSPTVRQLSPNSSVGKVADCEAWLESRSESQLLISIIMTFEDLCVLFYYPPSAGGKFIINSLGLSKHCVLHSPRLAQWELEQTDIDLLYKKKLETVLKTVPEHAFDGTWQKYELGVGASWFQHKNITITPELQKIIDSSKHFCLIYHNIDELRLILSMYPRTPVVKLTNFVDWMVYCSSKTKITDIDEKRLYWSFVDKNELVYPTTDWILVDIDDSIRSMVLMQQQIQMLYNKFGFDDFDESRWRQYYTKYAQSHRILGTPSLIA